jgi:acyl homoserine lactone synthase
MEDIVFTTLNKLSPIGKQQLGRYRYTVFVEEMHWDLPSVGPGVTEEWDEFDQDETAGVIVYAQDRRICGYARLLPTTRPYLLSEIFPDLCPVPVINDPFTWELSRFTTFDRDGGCNLSRMRTLLHSIFMVSQEHGIRRLIGVAPSSMERLYRRLGLVLRFIGPQRENTDLAAFSLDIDAAGLRALSDGHNRPMNFPVTSAPCESTPDQ